MPTEDTVSDWQTMGSRAHDMLLNVRVFVPCNHEWDQDDMFFLSTKWYYSMRICPLGVWVLNRIHQKLREWEDGEGGEIVKIVKSSINRLIDKSLIVDTLPSMTQIQEKNYPACLERTRRTHKKISACKVQHHATLIQNVFCLCL